MAEPIALVHDLLRQQGHPLDPFFTPSTVAVIGATETEGSVGRTLLRNLIASPFGGTVFPVNPKRAGVLGIKQPDRRPWRRGARALCGGAAHRRGRPGERRAARRAHAAGHDRPHADRRATARLRVDRGEARAGELDGRGDGAGGRRHPEPRGHSHLRVSRHGGPRLLLDVAIHLQPARALRDAHRRRGGTGRRRRCPRHPRAREGRGDDAARRAPVEAGAVGLEQPAIREIDINPLLASASRLVALDARAVLHPADVRREEVPRTAIRPYPAQYVRQWSTADGREVTLRPIRPEDEPLMVAFHRSLSERTVRLRFEDSLALDARTAHERLIRVCFIDYDREIALVAERRHEAARAREIVAIARLRRQRTGGAAEFSLVVSDAWQGRGLGTELLARIVGVGREERMTRIRGRILAENTPMQRLCGRVGFTLRPEGERMVVAELPL